MPLDTILDRRLAIISGKGGVGKTTVAAAIGVLAARSGKRVLVAEVEGKSALAELFEVAKLTEEPRKLRQNLYGMNISAEEALQEYFDVQLHMKAIAKPLIASQLVDYVTHSAPGLRDILLLGKVWYAATRRKEFDLIVLDSAAAGHAVSMLRSPEGFLHAVPIGPLANHARGILEWLQDPSQVSIHLASLAEEMPVNETIETTRKLEGELGMDVSHVFLNMLYPPISVEPEGPAHSYSAAALVTRAEAAGAQLSEQTAAELSRLADFYAARRTLQQEHRRELVAELSSTAVIVDLPYLFRKVFSEDDLDTLADDIERQLSA